MPRLNRIGGPAVCRLGSSLLCATRVRSRFTADAGDTDITVTRREKRASSLFFLNEFLIAGSGNIFCPQRRGGARQRERAPPSAHPPEGRHRKHQINSACLEEQLPANEIKISLALDVSPKHISLLSAKYSPLALSYLPASPCSSLTTLLPSRALQLQPSHLCGPPIPPLPSFWEVSVLIRGVITCKGASWGCEASDTLQGEAAGAVVGTSHRGCWQHPAVPAWAGEPWSGAAGP